MEAVGISYSRCRTSETTSCLHCRPLPERWVACHRRQGGLHRRPGHVACPRQPLEDCMVWPRPVPCPELCSVLDPVATVTGSIEQVNLNRTYRNNLAAALARIDARAQQEGKNPCDYCVVVDLGGSKVQMGWRVAPCLTRSRGASHAFWNIQVVAFFLRESCAGCKPWISMT